jgi:hypothetical protein
MSGCFGLGKIQHLLDVRDAHLFVFVDQVEDADPGFIAQSFEYLFAKRYVKMFKPHESGESL